MELDACERVSLWITDLCGISDMIMWQPDITDILVPTGSSWLLWFIAKWAFQQVVSILKSRCLTTTKSPHTEFCSDSQWKSFWTSIKHPSFKNNLFKDKFLEGISTRRGRLYMIYIFTPMSYWCQNWGTLSSRARAPDFSCGGFCAANAGRHEFVYAAELVISLAE